MQVDFCVGPSMIVVPMETLCTLYYPETHFPNLQRLSRLNSLCLCFLKIQCIELFHQVSTGMLFFFFFWYWSWTESGVHDKRWHRCHNVQLTWAMVWLFLRALFIMAIDCWPLTFLQLGQWTVFLGVLSPSSTAFVHLHKPRILAPSCDVTMIHLASLLWTKSLMWLVLLVFSFLAFFLEIGQNFYGVSFHQGNTYTMFLRIHWDRQTLRSRELKCKKKKIKLN